MALEEPKCTLHGLLQTVRLASSITTLIPRYFAPLLRPARRRHRSKFLWFDIQLTMPKAAKKSTKKAAKKPKATKKAKKATKKKASPKK